MKQNSDLFAYPKLHLTIISSKKTKPKNLERVRHDQLRQNK